MNKFKPGVRVVVIDPEQDVKNGTIVSVYESAEVAIVRLDDGPLEKVHFSRLGVEPVTEAKEVGITINHDEFKRIAVNAIIDSEFSDDPRLMATAVTLVTKIHKSLFSDSE